MATTTATVQSGEWLYPDKGGQLHTVTANDTFTMALVDTGTGGRYTPNPGQSVTTTDGHVIEFLATEKGYFTAAGNTAEADLRGSLGEMITKFSGNGEITRWKLISINVDDADDLGDITAASWEDTNDRMRVFSWASIGCSTA